MRFRFEKATQTDFNFDHTKFQTVLKAAELEFITEFSCEAISRLLTFLLVSAFAMGKSPPALPSRLIVARLLIAKSNAHDKKAKELSMAVKSPAGKAKAKSTAKENQPPTAAGKKEQSIVIA